MQDENVLGFVLNLPQRFCWVGRLQVRAAAARLPPPSCCGKQRPPQYAKQFTVDECTGGYELIVPLRQPISGGAAGRGCSGDLPQGTTVLQQPIENIFHLLHLR